MDLDWERDSLLQLLGLLIEVLAELSNRDSSLDGKHGKMMDDPFKMYEKSELEKHSDVTLCHTALPECRCGHRCRSITHKISERTEYILTLSLYIYDECECSVAVTFWGTFTLYTRYIHTEMQL